MNKKRKRQMSEASFFRTSRYCFYFYKYINDIYLLKPASYQTFTDGFNDQPVTLLLTAVTE